VLSQHQQRVVLALADLASYSLSPIAVIYAITPAFIWRLPQA
jgi:hypothetical protein